MKVLIHWSKNRKFDDDNIILTPTAQKPYVEMWRAELSLLVYLHFLLEQTAVDLSRILLISKEESWWRSESEKEPQQGMIFLSYTLTKTVKPLRSLLSATSHSGSKFTFKFILTEPEMTQPPHHLPASTSPLPSTLEHSQVPLGTALPQWQRLT